MLEKKIIEIEPLLQYAKKAKRVNTRSVSFEHKIPNLVRKAHFLEEIAPVCFIPSGANRLLILKMKIPFIVS